MDGILNIDWLRMTDYEETHDTYVFTVEGFLPRRMKLIPHCLTCPTPLINFGKRTRQFQDLPMHGKKVEIIYVLQRYRCPTCGKTSTAGVVEGFDEKRSVTLRFIDYVVTRSAGRTFTMLALDLGVHEKTIRNIVKDYHDARKDIPRIQKTPTVLGIDEVHLIHEMRCVITDIQAATLYDMLVSRKAVEVSRALRAIPFKEKIKVVTMDMYKSYKIAVRRTLPGAVIVVDKYHVIKDANKCMDTVRKAIQDHHKQNRKLHKKERLVLKRGRFKLFRRAHRLKPFDKMTVDAWCSTFPTLGEAYRAKEAFFDIYLAETREEAEERYMQWLMDLSPEMEVVFATILTFMSNWSVEIFNYFDHRFTNATTEALNGIIKIANRNGRGYLFETLRHKMLAHKGAKLTTIEALLEEEAGEAEPTLKSA